MTKDLETQAIEVLVGSLEAFSTHCLQVADKKGSSVPFVWNAAQKALHARLEQQIRETGKVRALVLKGRQMGISTYAAARFYHKTTTGFGRRTLIVAHQQKSTNNLFDMVKRFHRHNPLPISTKNSNATELVFDKTDSKYSLATAGTEDVARGTTAQFAHLSEFGFWSNGQKHMAGLGNTIPDTAGSEIIIESTANGLGNAFHQMWQDAEAGKGEFIAVFLPWFLDDGYRATIRPDFELSPDDVAYQHAYGLDMEQMQWRANKIATYGDGFQYLWSQEYPATAAEAFQTSTLNPLISPSLVMAAVNNVMFRERQGPLLIGCDPAGEGDDRTAIVFRQGRTVFRVEYHTKLDTMQIAGKLAQYHRDMNPDGIFVDKLGLGAGVYDRLMDLGIPVIGVGAGSRATNSERYENKRAEMWWLMAEWFANAPVRLPNDAALIADLSTFQPETSSNGRRQLESKQKLKRRGIRSPDGGDALSLTFSEPVQIRGSNLFGESHYQAPTSAGY